MRAHAPLVLCALAPLALLSQDPAPAAGRAERDRIARGRYLVHHVAMCIQCHTPRDESRALIRERLLCGAPFPLPSPYEEIEFAVRAPHIAGLPGYTEEQGVRLLVEGIGANGKPPQPPMPPFRMNAEDARAVVAYLRSLPD